MSGYHRSGFHLTFKFVAGSNIVGFGDAGRDEGDAFGPSSLSSDNFLSLQPIEFNS